MTSKEIRIGYTRSGRRLHAIQVERGQRMGRTLCDGRPAWRHPRYDSETTAVAMSLSFNGGCKKCLDRC